MDGMNFPGWDILRASIDSRGQPLRQVLTGKRRRDLP